MLKLMALEIEKYKMKTYVFSSIISCIILIAFTYFISVVSLVEKDPLFQNYSNIFKFTGIMGMIIFIIFSSVMYSRFIIEEYSGKKLILLFSYPISRKKVFLAKVYLVTLFTITAFIISNGACLAIFSITESIHPIVSDRLTGTVFLTAAKTILLTAFTIGALGIISMAIGFVKKSMPTTIIASFALAATIGNMIIQSLSSIGMILLCALIMLDIIAIMILINKINQMDVL